jgi:hypothetical protein
MVKYMVMQTEIRLSSIIDYGIGGPETGAIELIYHFLLKEFEQNFYRRIGINQVGNNLDEVILKEPGDKIHININYPLTPNFAKKDNEEKNKIHLDFIHTALLRILDYDKKFDKERIEQIRNKILEKNFSFEFICKCFVNKKNTNLIAKIVVQPKIDRFDYFIVIEENGVIKCKLKIYSGKTDIFYFDALLSSGKWQSINKLIITGKRKDVEIQVDVEKCEVAFKNLTNYSKAPYFEMMRADISEADREKAYQDWLHSLPPANRAIITHEPN